MGRVVGIDFGLARFGLAISDQRRIIAQPLCAIRAGKTPLESAQKIQDALKSYKEIEEIVLGYPLLLSGKEGTMAVQVKMFKYVLEEQLKLPVILWDERLTSMQVEKLLKAASVKRKKRSELSDALAAATILHNFLDAQAHI